MVNHPNRGQYAKAFNEWMRRFASAPEQFARQFDEVAGYLRDRNEGREPSYGEVASAYFEQLLQETAHTARSQ